MAALIMFSGLTWGLIARSGGQNRFTPMADTSMETWDGLDCLINRCYWLNVAVGDE